jgi:hypothetical protein
MPGGRFEPCPSSAVARDAANRAAPEDKGKARQEDQKEKFRKYAKEKGGKKQ